MASLPDINGQFLDIDPAIQKICEVSNNTSSSTRSVLYILVIVSILSLIAVANTRPKNWSSSRLNHTHTNMREAEIYNEDSLSFYKASETVLIRNKIENYQTVRVPILGNAFDVNDLNIVAGITFLILLFILRFTIIREVNNLKIALQAISERYTDGANKNVFQDYLTSQAKSNPHINQSHVLAKINFTRRKHHYNFLSMNEIFTLPPLEIEDSKKGNGFFIGIVNKMYWLPSWILLLILANDISTIGYGLNLSRFNTMIGLISGIIILVLIGFLCHRCSNQKRIINKLYQDFRSDEYRYIKKSYSYAAWPVTIVILIQLLILLFITYKTDGLEKLF